MYTIPLKEVGIIVVNFQLLFVGDWFNVAKERLNAGHETIHLEGLHDSIPVDLGAVLPDFHITTCDGCDGRNLLQARKADSVVEIRLCHAG